MCDNYQHKQNYSLLIIMKNTAPYSRLPKIFLVATFAFMLAACSPDNDQPPAPATAPTAVNDLATTNENAAVNIAVLQNDRANSADGNLNITGVSAASNGNVAISGATVTYTPQSGFNGSDSFTYSIENSAGLSASATVNVTVNESTAAGVPAAVDDAESVAPNGTVRVDVLRNDSANTDDGNLTITNVTVPANGSATEDNGEIVYTPNANVSGTTDTFDYTIQNSDNETATATVTITINNAIPTAVADSEVVEPDSSGNVLDVLDNDSANTSGTLTITNVTAASNGTVSINNGEELLYTPTSGVADVTDTFDYTIENKDGETATATVTVNITNNAAALPTAIDDTASLNQNSPRNTIDVLSNDTDPNSVALTISDAPNRSTQGGIVRVAADGLSIIYEPPINFTGEDTFDYTASNGTFTDTATATITVNAFNPAQMQYRPCEAEATERKAAGRPYCFDIGIPVGYDGHKVWATVFVPAQEILDKAEKPPVILHAHGFGESRFASMENPNSFMKFRITAQALLELWHEGYWVVSFDQRGFNASGLWGNSAESSNSDGEFCTRAGDTACIDVMSPEREARDPTVVIDWISENLCDGFETAVTPDQAATSVPSQSSGCGNNMPLYAQGATGDPKLGTIGLSYGGGWQTMSSANDKVLNDTLGLSRAAESRVDAMVLVTTWYDLRYSLIQNGVPKSAWFQFLTAATQLGGTTLAPDGFLLNAGNEVFVQDNVSQATLDGLLARSVRSYCENIGDDSFADADDTDLDPELGSGTAITGPDVFVIQGQRDMLFNYNEAYDLARCYKDKNTSADVRMLIETEGHILATAQAPSYKDTQESGESQIIYIDETVFCDSTNTPLSSREMINDWFRTKLGAVDSYVDNTDQDIDDLPNVCVTHFEPNAAPVSGRSNTSLDDVIIGGSLTVELDGDAGTAGAQEVAFTIPTNPPLSADNAGVAPPPPVHQQELITANGEMEVVGIPTADLTITASGFPSLDPPRFFLGIAVQRGGAGPLKIIGDQVTPISIPAPEPNPDCLGASACTVTDTYPRTDDKGILHGETVGRLIGFGVKLQAGDKLVLVIHDQIPLYNQHGTNPGAYQVTVTGSVTLPVVP